MSTVLIDTCIVSDLADETSDWFEWSSSMLESLDGSHSFVINDIIYAEASIIFPFMEEFNNYISLLDFQIIAMSREALFLAGKAYLKYRKNKGAKCNVLPDFFIGAHAAVSGYSLMTRDKGHFSTYFPTVDLIIPNH